MADEQRFVLGLAYQAGRDPRIAKGADGGRDFFTAEELEKACWSFLPGGGEIGLFHADGTVGHLTVTENSIYRGPDWEQPDGTVIKAGDWLIGGICDETAWRLVKEGKVTGFSPQGVARRITPRDVRSET
ncbi:XkdF-like putative serine protease domain-containing protein [Streptomyces sp. NPDC001634]|uniref:XkdF-like putative serine protease domain-containing protein n=1 Tax=Streptomyces sp. NPDC001634 TaxID=3154390 RepID=UPI00332BDD9F